MAAEGVEVLLVGDRIELAREIALLGGAPSALRIVHAPDSISMDSHGVPIKIFTVNRWVTGDVWYTAKDVTKMLKIFEVDIAHPSWPVNRWVSGMVHLFRPQIERLLIERDQVVRAWEKAHPDPNVYEDRDLELISEIPISIDDQVKAVTKALRKTKKRNQR